MKKIIKNSLTIVLVLLTVLFILYSLLCIFVKSKGIKIDCKIFSEESNICLSEEQIKIASFILNKDKNPKFKKNPLVIDIFSQKNNIPKYISIRFIDYHHVSTNERRLEELATSRRIIRKVDYKTLYNYYFSKIYFGNELFGIDKASRKYFNKEYIELDSKEFISLCVLLLNPSFYNFSEHKKRLDDKVEEIYNEFYK